MMRNFTFVRCSGPKMAGSTRTRKVRVLQLSFIIPRCLPRPGSRPVFRPRRRPAPDMAPTDAKAACLYPNAGRALREAADRGFDNAILCDPIGNIAEFATANLFTVSNGAVYTPIPNGTFLNGITRQRVIGLLRDNGYDVHERTITIADLETADEIFSTGNHGNGSAGHAL